MSAPKVPPPELYIPPCICHLQGENHPPPVDKPLRIHIRARVPSVQRLFPNLESVTWQPRPDYQPVALKLSSAIYEALYGQKPASEDIVLRFEENRWMEDEPVDFSFHSEILPYEIRHFGYLYPYAVTFDHLVPQDDMDPEVLVLVLINFWETDPQSTFSPKQILFEPYRWEPEGKILAIPRCCHLNHGMFDRSSVNSEVNGL